jgi:hypothetical protein
VSEFTDSTYQFGSFVLDADGADVAVDYVGVYPLPQH